MVYVTGDCHADFRKFSTDRFPDQKEMTRDDIVIVCGDFGIWDNSNEEKYWLKWLNEKPFTTVFVDGNHECFHKDTEVLTDKGWVNIATVVHDPDMYNVASVNMDTGFLSYSKPLSTVSKYAEELIFFDGTNFSQCVTPNHDVIIRGEKMKACDAAKLSLREEDFRFHINTRSTIVDLSDDMIRLLTYIVMDGTIVDYSKYQSNSNKKRIQFHFKKRRKVESLQSILDRMEIDYTLTTAADGSEYIRIYGEDAREIFKWINADKCIPDNWRWFSDHQFSVFIEALTETDGTINQQSLYWRTISKHDADLVSEMCVLHNYDLNVRILEHASGYGSDKSQFKLSIKKDKRLDHKIKIQSISYNDMVYCLTMYDGTLVTRFNYIPCVTGNCFDRLYSDEFPIVDFHGGRAHKIRPHIFHLMRGYMFTFDGKKFWCFGGASSHDIDDGILDADDFETPQAFYAAIKQGYKYGKQFRINHISWWEQELPSQEEMDFGMKTLEENGFETDFVISHCCPQDVASVLGFHGADRLTMYFNEVASRTKFNRWYFGHYHGEESVWGKFILHYDRIERIV